MTSSPSRRQTLQMIAAAGASLAGLASAQPPGQTRQSLRLGISTLGFADRTNRQLAQELVAERISLVQLFFRQTDSRYWKFNSVVDVSELTPARCRQIADDYRSSGVEIDSIGVYTNLIHPDPDQRAAALAYFQAMMKIGAEMGVRRFVTEAGHYQSDGPEPRIPHHLQEAVWPQMIQTARQLAELADRHGATVLIEPFYRGFFASAKRTRVFLDEVDSPRLRVLLDPANLLEVNDLPEMFQQLGPRIDCLHAKDRKLHVDRGVAAGQGDLDYAQFLQLAARHVPHAPLILEYVGPKDYRQALAHIRAIMRQVGIDEA